MSEDGRTVNGGCYCGKVRYHVTGLGTEVTECHCSQCRKQSGHRYAVVDARAGNVEIDGEDGITWFRASPSAERGFCSTCGSHLFWRSLGGDDMAILAASIDEPTGVRMTCHIFVKDKGDYYEITDDLPRFDAEDTQDVP